MSGRFLGVFLVRYNGVRQVMMVPELEWQSRLMQFFRLLEGLWIGVREMRGGGYTAVCKTTKAAAD